MSYKTVNIVVSSLYYLKNVKSVIDSAALHSTRWLMVFPRNVGFGRCYLVSTRHEILSNIDQNTKPNQNSATAPKKPKWNEYGVSTNPVLRVSVVFQFFDFQLTMFLEVHNKKVLLELPQSRANFQPDMASCWTDSAGGQLDKHRSTPHRFPLFYGNHFDFSQSNF